VPRGEQLAATLCENPSRDRFDGLLSRDGTRLESKHWRWIFGNDPSATQRDLPFYATVIDETTMVTEVTEVRWNDLGAETSRQFPVVCAWVKD
jgi:hypothetical protein